VAAGRWWGFALRARLFFNFYGCFVIFRIRRFDVRFDVDCFDNVFAHVATVTPVEHRFIEIETLEEAASGVRFTNSRVSAASK
jgi:hypothetical protein